LDCREFRMAFLAVLTFRRELLLLQICNGSYDAWSTVPSIHVRGIIQR